MKMQFICWYGVAAPRTRNDKETRKATFWIVILRLSWLLQNAVEFERYG